MKAKVLKDVAIVVGFIVLVGHMVTIAEDVNRVVNDPNEENKPAEVAKLVFDVSRYLR